MSTTLYIYTTLSSLSLQNKTLRPLSTNTTTLHPLSLYKHATSLSPALTQEVESSPPLPYPHVRLHILRQGGRHQEEELIGGIERILANAEGGVQQKGDELGQQGVQRALTVLTELVHVVLTDFGKGVEGAVHYVLVGAVQRRRQVLQHTRPTFETIHFDYRRYQLNRNRYVTTFERAGIE